MTNESVLITTLQNTQGQTHALTTIIINNILLYRNKEQTCIHNSNN